MEYFDLVNQKDEVIGVTTKEQSHANGEIHRVVAIFVFDKDGRLYMQEHLVSGGKYDHSVGGHVKQGESYDEAAKREGYEELGLTETLSKVSVFYSDERFSGGKNHHMFAIYEITPSDDWKFIPNHEVANIIPMPIEDIVQMMNKEHQRFTGGFNNTLKEYLRVKQLPFVVNV